MDVNTPASFVLVDDQPLLRDIVRDARHRRGLTQESLAELVGMSQRWVSAMETGDIDMPRSDTMQRLSNTLDIPIADLYVAGRWAQTREEARRIAEVSPTYDDPIFDLILADARRLTPASRRALRQRALELAETEAQIAEDMRRDGP